MSSLVAILRAAHCRSTHHYFAIDALERIDTPGGRRLATVLLAHYGEYLDGAKAPDTKFKDFQNHVIHVSDNNWGGAPKACETWLARVIEHMHKDQWPEAAYAIGVLSHYFTDPLMPLHTAQHPSEAVVHRPMEWSVCKTYDVIYRKCSGHAEFRLENGSNWVSKAVLAAAAIAHPHYLPLIEQYDLKKGVADPPKGLNTDSRIILAEIFDFALSGWARILERIAQVSMIEIPICSLTLPTVLAAVQMPVKTIVSRITDVTEQRAVKAIFDEYQATGTVVRNVPAEIREVAMAKPVDIHSLPAPVLRSVPQPPVAIEPVDDEEDLVRPTDKVKSSAIASILAVNSENEADVADDWPPQSTEVAHVEAPESPVNDAVAAADDDDEDDHEDEGEDEEFETPSTDERAVPLVRAKSNSRVVAVPRDSSRRGEVTLESDIVDAPSIGPKTAARFYAIGIRTIRDFLAADHDEMASQLNAGWITGEVLIDWQDQAQLVVEVPALCGYKSQLLIGADCRTSEELANAQVERLQAAVAEFGRSTEGKRILRNTAVPGREEVAKWIASAAETINSHAA